MNREEVFLYTNIFRQLELSDGFYFGWCVADWTLHCIMWRHGVGEWSQKSRHFALLLLYTIYMAHALCSVWYIGITQKWKKKNEIHTHQKSEKSEKQNLNKKFWMTCGWKKTLEATQHNHAHSRYSNSKNEESISVKIKRFQMFQNGEM